ncbi:brachyurin-like isoform X3 [Aethina tumida]|uniref:brachyurin-like isoform X3 n=1 Tax=Aethina tumida TaxID=116153 RepID=UPI002148F210|nr:brachyurin-like isoform X3 [Aethina tumida]
MKCVLNLLLLSLVALTKQDDVKWLQLDQRRVSENVTEYTKLFQQSRIIGGTEAPKHSSPWQAALRINNKYLCGGSLVSKKFVLTAGHCTSIAEKVLVILGAHNLSEFESSQQRIWSASITTHPNYHKTFNDIGVVQLSTPARLNSYVQVVPLANRRSGKFNYVAATLSGWGRTNDESKNISQVLMRVNLITMPNIICNIKYRKYKGVIKNTDICTSGYGIKGTCNGDSGSPLITRGIQIGIVSFGPTLCETEMPSVFTRVSKFQTWIAQNTDVSF